MKWLFLFSVFLVLPIVVYPQVANNNIENRLELLPGKVLFSSTENCTVQPACIKESLTGKCIEFHNDQWFFYHTTESYRQYLNISGQDCRGIDGVQLVVLTGNPCQPETYTILDCISLHSQDDIYVKLPLLKPGHQVLLNVDGYLNDQCKFYIELSNTPKGIPVTKPENSLEIASKINGQIHTLNWEYDGRQAEELVQEFIVMRRKTTEAKASLSTLVLRNDNTYGASGQYSYSDTVTSGTYVYQIFGVKINAEKILVAEIKEELKPETANNYSTSDKYITLTFDYKTRTPIHILVFNGTTNQLIRKDHIMAHRKAKSFRVYVGDQLATGEKLFRVVLHNLKDGSKKEELVKK